jgi:hypothetical protein
MRHALAPKTRALAPLLGIAKINLSNTHKLATIFLAASVHCRVLLLAPGLFPPNVDGPVPLSVVGPDAVPFGLPVAAPPCIEWCMWWWCLCASASAKVLERANTAANARVANLMVGSSNFCSH